MTHVSESGPQDPLVFLSISYTVLLYVYSEYVFVDPQCFLICNPVIIKSFTFGDIPANSTLHAMEKLPKFYATKKKLTAGKLQENTIA